MTHLTDTARLERIKTLMFGENFGNHHDSTLTGFIEEVIEELVDGGVARDVAESDVAVGCIYVGVNDLWNYSSGGVRHSDYFYKRLIQLSKKKVSDSDV